MKSIEKDLCVRSQARVGSRVVPFGLGHHRSIALGPNGSGTDDDRVTQPTSLDEYAFVGRA